MDEYTKQLNQALTDSQVAQSKELSRLVKRKTFRAQTTLVGDTLRQIVLCDDAKMRRLLARNVWGATEHVVLQFDAAGGSKFVRGCFHNLLTAVPLNHPGFAKAEAKVVADFLGNRTAKLLGLNRAGMQRLADEAAENRGPKMISKTWTLEYSMATCGCKPARTAALDSPIAALNPLKAIALAALVLSDILAMSNPATVPLAALSIATAAIMAARGC